MAEANLYTLSHRELIELIIKSLNIHEGLWELNVNFSIAPTTFIQNSDSVAPGIIAAVQKFGIQRVEPENLTKDGLVVDASKVNPPTTARKITKNILSTKKIK